MQNKTDAFCLGALVRCDPSGLRIVIGLRLFIGKSTSCKSQRLISNGLTSGVIVGAKGNRPKMKEPVHERNKSKARKVPAPEISIPLAKTVCFQCLFLDLYVLFKNYGVVQKDN